MNTGHEARSHRALEYPPRHAAPRGNHGVMRAWTCRCAPCASRSPRRRPDVHLERLPVGTRRVTDHRGAGDGGRCHRDAGHLPLRPDGGLRTDGFRLLHRHGIRPSSRQRSRRGGSTCRRRSLRRPGQGEALRRANQGLETPVLFRDEFFAQQAARSPVGWNPWRKGRQQGLRSIRTAQVPAPLPPKAIRHRSLPTVPR